MNIEAIEPTLNRFDSRHVWESLHDIHEHPLRGAETSERGFTGTLDAATATPGVRVLAAGDKMRLRVTVVEKGGAFYDEFEMTPRSLEGLGDALAAVLDPRPPTKGRSAP